MFCLTKIVHGRLATWSRVPPAMDPNPLLRIFSNDVFEHFRELPRVFEDIAFRVARSNQFHGGLETEPVLTEMLVPNGIPGNNCRVRVECQACDSCSRACRLSEEIHEDCFLRHGVLVSKDANGSGFLQNF